MDSKEFVQGLDKELEPLRSEIVNSNGDFSYRLGSDRRARWTEVAQRGAEEGARDARSVYGNVQIAFGENYSLGGKNKTTPMKI
jgi:hypothetical protein